jgi:hypothetical protein
MRLGARHGHPHWSGYRTNPVRPLPFRIRGSNRLAGRAHPTPEPGGAESEPRTPLAADVQSSSRGGVRREKCGEVLGRRGRNLVAQYPLDHILVYRCDQNLPYKFSDA